MKVSQSVRMLYEELAPKYAELKKEVDRIILGRKQPRWHYESRVKEVVSFALKLETGRVSNPVDPEDLFACTLVVENRGRIAEAEALVNSLFRVAVRRPKDPKFTHMKPHSFEFDDLRLYARWADEAGKPMGLEGLQFEVQIKTFLQHAWGIATHDFMYKSDDVDWSGSRIAYQVKAMLENAELSISEAKNLASSAMLDRVDDECLGLRHIITEVRKRWEADLLPKDLRRLAQNLVELSWALDIGMDDIWIEFDEATVAGEGANTLNLSPYGAVIKSLCRKRGAAMFSALEHHNNRHKVFIPLEIDLPDLPRSVRKKLVQPPGTPPPKPIPATQSEPTDAATLEATDDDTPAV